MTIMSEQLKIKKMTLPELSEALERQNKLIKSTVFEKLKDKGTGIKKTRELLVSEIEYRKNLELIENSMSQLTIRTPSEIDADEHTKRLCRLEKDPKERFKPFFTLRKAKAVRTDSPALKTMDVGPVNTKATQLLNLSVSIDLLVQQEERTKEGQFKSKQERLLYKAEQEQQQQAEESHSDYEESEEESDPDPDRSDGEDKRDK